MADALHPSLQGLNLRAGQGGTESDPGEGGAVGRSIGTAPFQGAPDQHGVRDIPDVMTDMLGSLERHSQYEPKKNLFHQGGPQDRFTGASFDASGVKGQPGTQAGRLAVDLPDEPAARLDVGNPSESLEVSPEAIARRAQAWSWALPKNSEDDITSMLKSGKEDQWRKDQALDRDKQKLSTFPITADSLKITNPKTWPETAMAVKYIKNIENTPYVQHGDFSEFATLFPGLNKTYQAASINIATKVGILYKFREEQEKLRSEMGWASYLTSEARDFLIPTIGNVRRYGASGLLFAGGPEAQAERNALMTQRSTDDFESLIQEKLQGKNPIDNIPWIDQMISHATSDNFWDFLMGTTDLSATPGLGAAGKIALTGMGAYSSMGKLSSMLHAAGIRPGVLTATASGDLGEAALRTALDETVKTAKGFNVPRMTDDVFDKGVFSIMKKRTQQATELGHNFLGALPNEAMRRISTILDVTDSKFRAAVGHMITVNKMDPVVAMSEVLRAIQENIKTGNLFKGVNNTLIDIHDRLVSDISTQSYNAYLIIGNEKAELFKTENEAHAYANFYGYRDPVIKQQGGGFYIEKRIPIDSNSNVIRDALKLVPAMQAPQGMYTALLKTIRKAKYVNPDELMPEVMRGMSKTVMYLPNNLMKPAVEAWSETLKLPYNRAIKGKQRAEEFDRIVHQAIDDIDPQTKQPGYWMPTRGELEARWYASTGHFPDEQQVAQYFVLQKIHNMDWAFRNMIVGGEKRNRGVMQWFSKYIDPKTGQSVSSPGFNGKDLDKMPVGDKTIAIMDAGGKVRLIAASKMKSEERGIWNEELKTGYTKIIELENEENSNYALTGMPRVEGGEVLPTHRVDYVLTRRAENKEIEPIQVPYRGGPHMITKHPYMVVQPRVIKDEFTGKHILHSDSTLYAIDRLVHGQAGAKALNEILRLIKSGAEDEAKTYLNDHFPMLQWSELQDMLKAQRDVNGVLRPARLSLDHPVGVVSTGKSFIDTEAGKDFRTKFQKADGSSTLRDLHMENRYKLPFTQERDSQDLLSMRNEGTPHNPVFNFRKAEWLDPMTSLTRAWNRVATQVPLESYKKAAIDALHEFAGSSGAYKSLEEVRNAPYYYLHNLDDAFIKAVNPELKHEIETRALNIRALTGLPSETESVTHSIAQKLSDMVYNKFSPTTGHSLLTALEMGKTRDFTRFMRSVVFHKSLGLFNPAMYWLHGSTWTNVVAISGIRAGGAGAVGAWMHILSAYNRSPEIMSGMSKIAEHFGWKPGQLEEGIKEMERSGFLKEQGTYILHDAVLNNEIVRAQGKKFLDAGLFFFKGGLAHMRRGAYMTAYHEFRNGAMGKLGVGHLGALTDLDRRQILERADLLAHNMTRASSSQFQRGLWSVPLQFSTYFQRLTELAVGNRLTIPEKLRLVGTNMALYGIPAGVSLVGFFPFEDTWRKQALESGYQPGKNSLSTMFMEGLPASMLGWATGTYLGFGQRFGPKSAFNGLAGDKDYLQIASGALGTSMASALFAMNPLLWFMYSNLPGVTDEPSIRLNPYDAATVAREATSINTGWNIVNGLRYGEWYAKRMYHELGDQPQESNIPVWQTLTMGVSGLRSTKMSDVYLEREIQKAEKGAFTAAMYRGITEYKRGLDSLGKQDPEQAKSYFNRAEHEWINLPLEYRLQAMRLVAGGTEYSSQEEQIDSSFRDWRKTKEPR